MSSHALSTKQFGTEQALLHQGNMDELTNRVRGIQNMTSNVYRPAFSTDYTAVHSQPSGTAFGGEGGMDEEE